MSYVHDAGGWYMSRHNIGMLPGDINADGNISIVDIALVIELLSGVENPASTRVIQEKTVIVHNNRHL